MGETRAWGRVSLVVAELWTVFWASSLAYMVQGTQRWSDYDWLMVALLIVDGIILIPVGWSACLRGSHGGLRNAQLSAVALLGMALVVGLATLDARPDWGPTAAVGSALVFAVPAALLGWGIRRSSERIAGRRRAA